MRFEIHGDCGSQEVVRFRLETKGGGAYLNLNVVDENGDVVCCILQISDQGVYRSFNESCYGIRSDGNGRIRDRT